MKGVTALFVGIFATFAFSWTGLTLIPNFQIGHLDPQSDEEGTDIYPMPKSGMAERGRKIYAANGCVYCHSQQVRADYAASDIDRTRDQNKKQNWAQRRSAPRDYIFDRPVMLGKTRMGPDLADIGKSAPSEEPSASPATSASPAASAAAAPTSPAPPPTSAAPPSSPAASAAASPAPTSAPAMLAETTAPPGDGPAPYSAAWHHLHLYSPRKVTGDSNMPAYKFLYEKRRISGQRAEDALKLTGPDAVPEDWEVVPSYDAKCLVAYLMSLDQSHELKEAKLGSVPAPASSPAPASAPAAKEEKK